MNKGGSILTFIVGYRAALAYNYTNTNFTAKVYYNVPNSTYALTASLMYQNVSCSGVGSNVSLSGQGALTLKIGSPLVISAGLSYDQCNRTLMVAGSMTGQWQVFSGMNVSDISLNLVRR